MKKVTVLGLTSTNKFIAFFDHQHDFAETKFQGFDINPNFKFRPYLDEIIGTEIQCSYSKAQKVIRYQNQSLFMKLIQCGAFTINSKELEQSKIYSLEQKKKFQQGMYQQKSKELLINTNQIIYLNQMQDDGIICDLIRSKKALKSRIQFLTGIILLRFFYQEKLIFLKCKIDNYKHYFQLFPEINFWKSKILPIQVQIKIIAQKYNLLLKKNQVFVSLEQSIIYRFLKEGFISLNQKDYFKNQVQTFQQLSDAQNNAIKTMKGVYSKKSQILNFIYTQKNYVGIVTGVVEGYIFDITASKSHQVGRVQLQMVVCPVGNDVGSFESREFSRKQLIGQQVNIYLQKEGELNTTGNIIRTSDWTDIELLLLESGFAYVRQEYRNSSLGYKYNSLETKAKQKKKGLHNKDIGNRRFEDLTQPLNNKNQISSYLERRFEVLNKLSQSQQVVVEQIINSLVFKVRVQSLNIIINVRLQGVVGISLNPNLKQYSEIIKESENFLKNNYYQRNLTAQISDYEEETNQFRGNLFSDKDKCNLQEILILNSFLYADKYNFVSKYNDLENQAKKQNKLIWQPQIRCFEPSFQFDKEKFCFEGRFSWISNGKIAFVQPKDNFKTLENIQNKIREMKLNKLPKLKQKIGAWCVATYEDELYRAIIKSKKDDQVTVEFMDWGNQEIKKVDTLKELPEQFLYIQKQCIKVSLNLVSGTKNKQALQKVRQILFEGGVYVFKKQYGNSINFYANQNVSMNQQLIMKGLLKADINQLKMYDNKQQIRKVQEDLRKQRIGIWEESDSSDEQTQEY